MKKILSVILLIGFIVPFLTNASAMVDAQKVSLLKELIAKMQLLVAKLEQLRNLSYIPQSLGGGNSVIVVPTPAGDGGMNSQLEKVAE